MKKNRMNDVLDDASRVVSAWPKWMQRPEVRMLGRYCASQASIPTPIGLHDTDCVKPIDVKKVLSEK